MVSMSLSCWRIPSRKVPYRACRASAAVSLFYCPLVVPSPPLSTVVNARPVPGSEQPAEPGPPGRHLGCRPLGAAPARFGRGMRRPRPSRGRSAVCRVVHPGPRRGDHARTMQPRRVLRQSSPAVRLAFSRRGGTRGGRGRACGHVSGQHERANLDQLTSVRASSHHPDVPPMLRRRLRSRSASGKPPNCH